MHTRWRVCLQRTQAFCVWRPVQMPECWLVRSDKKSGISGAFSTPGALLLAALGMCLGAGWGDEGFCSVMDMVDMRG